MNIVSMHVAAPVITLGLTAIGAVAGLDGVDMDAVFDGWAEGVQTATDGAVDNIISERIADFLLQDKGMGAGMQLLKESDPKAFHAVVETVRENYFDSAEMRDFQLMGQFKEGGMQPITSENFSQLQGKDGVSPPTLPEEFTKQYSTVTPAGATTENPVTQDNVDAVKNLQEGLKKVDGTGVRDHVFGDGIAEIQKAGQAPYLESMQTLPEAYIDASGGKVLQGAMIGGSTGLGLSAVGIGMQGGWTDQVQSQRAQAPQQQSVGG